MQADPDTTLIHLRPDQLHPDPNNPRKLFDDAALARLADSIRAEGVLEPIIARRLSGGGAQIIAGERRWRAAHRAGVRQVPVLMRNDLDESRRRLVQTIENLQREDLTLAEQADALATLVADRGLRSTAAQVGQSKTWVSRRAGLRGLPDPIWPMVQAGQIRDPELAHELAKLQALDVQLAAQFAERFRDPEGLGMPSRGELRAAVKKAGARAQRQAELAEQSAEQSPAQDPVVGAGGDFSELGGGPAELAGQSAEAGAATTAPPAMIEDSTLQQQMAELAQQLQGVVATAMGSHADSTGVQVAHSITQPAARMVRLQVTGTTDVLQRLMAALAEAVASHHGEESSSEDVQQFIARVTRPDPQARIKASRLLAAYRDDCRARGCIPVTLQEFGAAVESAGVAKRRFAEGVHYMGLTMAGVQ